jgi:hypothetical protein
LTNKKGRGAGFLLLAGLTLLIAGFVARHEIPGLIRQAAQSPAQPAQADIGVQEHRGGMPDFHPPGSLYAGAGTGDEKRHVLSQDRKSDKNGPSEHITDSDRRQLDQVIKDKAR